MSEPQTAPRTAAGRHAAATLVQFREWSADKNIKRVLAGATDAITAIEAESRNATLDGGCGEDRDQG